MANISENLQTLNEAKLAIKTAIENKGQDLTNVPFTQYAEKIAAIESGTSSAYTISDMLRNRNGRSCTSLFQYCADLTTEQLKEALDANPDFAPTKTDDMFNGCTSLVEVPKFDTSKVTAIARMFASCPNLKKVPDVIEVGNSSTASPTSMFMECHALEEAPYIDFSQHKSTVFQMFQNCRSLKTIPCYDFSKSTALYFFLLGCTSLEVVPAIDLRSVTGRVDSIVYGCSALKEIWFRNIGVSIQLGANNWGTKLTVESLLHIIKELRNMNAARTLTIATVNIDKIKDIYVRLIDITDEMRAEDDLIDVKLPFEVCESTDEGAMLITDYVALKNWSLA